MARKKSVATWSLIASGGLAILKFGAALMTGSLGLLSEAFHSLIDFGATIVTLLAVSLGDRPADDNHHYGHAKIESLAALAEIMLLCGVVGWFTYESLSRLIGGAHIVTFSWWAIAILLISMAVDFNRSRALHKIAVETSSGALAADAVHFHADILGSSAVLVGLILVRLGLPWGDAAATLVVAGFIAMVTWRLARQTIATLLDTAPDGVASAIRQKIEATSNVLSVAQLRVRPAGPVLFISIIVDVPRTLPVVDIAVLKQRIQDLVFADYPHADVIVSANPVELDTETVFEKAQLIAAQHGHSIHHLTVQQINTRTAVSFDIEFDGAIPLVEAHDKATALETAIRQSLGGNVEVESHIEPLPLRALEGQDASADERSAITRALEQSAVSENLMTNIHNIRVRFTDGGHFVHYHCRFDGAVSVEIVHDVIDRVEHRLMASVPSIKRVIAHAEPHAHVKMQ
jgi:cation diffusion facilitator family transporter